MSREIAVKNPIKTSINPTNIENCFESSPEAIGRLLFTGCNRSFFRSTKSFRRYIAPDTTQKIKKAQVAPITEGQWNNFCAKIRAASTTRFFVHWCGRRAIKRNLNSRMLGKCVLDRSSFKEPIPAHAAETTLKLPDPFASSDPIP